MISLAEIRDLAHRFVPSEAADERLYAYGARSWWPAHEIGHFLVATSDECQQAMFGIDDHAKYDSPKFRYIISRESAAISISQRMLRRSGHVSLADQEIQYTAEETLECSFERWCKRAVDKLLRANGVVRLPVTIAGMEALLTRKARGVGSEIRPLRRRATGHRPPKCLPVAFAMFASAIAPSHVGAMA